MVSFSDFCAGSVFTSALLDPTPLCTRLPPQLPKPRSHPPSPCGTSAKAAVPSRSQEVGGCAQPAWAVMGSRVPGSVCSEGPAAGTFVPACAAPVREGCSALGGTPWLRVWLRPWLPSPLADAQAGAGPSPPPLASCQSLKKGG